MWRRSGRSIQKWIQNTSFSFINSTEKGLPYVARHAHSLGLNDNQDCIPGKKASLVIFDKDGTIVDYASYWTAWLYDVTARLESSSGINLEREVAAGMGYTLETGQWGKGWVNENEEYIQEKLKSLLTRQGISESEATEIVKPIYYGEATPSLAAKVKGIDDPLNLFKILKAFGVKIAVCTADSRRSAENMLAVLKLNPYLDSVICGNDKNSMPKPNPANILTICQELNAEPNDSIMIGDSREDMIMGNNAKCKMTIGVLSGLTTRSDLDMAHVLCPSVKYALPYILPSDYETLYNARKEKITNISPDKVDYFSSVSGSVKSFLGSTTKKIFGSPKPNMFTDNLASNMIWKKNYSTGVSDSSTDYVIVGAGSAGCVLGNRLSADGNKVCLLEAGGSGDTWKVNMPAALMYTLFSPKYNWCYFTTAQRHMNSRKMYWPRAKMLGGCSSHNAMVYVRGHAKDFDRWETEGATGWSYADILPYFKKSQTHQNGEDDYRGGNGPLQVSRGPMTNPLHTAFIQAGQECGYPYTEDMNGFQQEGFGPMDMTIHKGVRANTSRGYLKPVSGRANLTVKTNAMTHRVLFDGKKAIGVEYKHRGKTQNIYANKEVILAGGAINSPQLLMLSGIGDGDHLKTHGIEVLEHLPGVGANLQDHLDLYIQYKCKQPITLYKYQWKFPHVMIKTGIEWFLFHSGSAASTHLESGAFIRSKPGLEHPDIQYHFLPSVVINHGSSLGDCHAYQVHASPMRSTSTGSIQLKNNNPNEWPLIDPNYLATKNDMDELKTAIRLTREIMAQKSFEPFNGGEIQPGIDVQSESELEEFIKAKADSAYHPSCTCKMGLPSDKMAVTDSNCKVLGISNLRVVDASIMPSIVSGNLNAAVVMMAEKAADLILDNPPLPKSKAKVYEPKTLETQR